MAELEEATADQHAPRPLDRVRLRRPRRARRGGAADRRERRRSRRDRRGRPSPRHLYAPEMPDPDLADPHVRRAARLELPALAVRVRRVRLHRHALARLRAGRASQRAGGVRAAAPQIRRQMSRSHLAPRRAARRPPGRARRSSGSAAGGCSRSSLVAALVARARVRDDGAAAAAARAGALPRRRCSRSSARSTGGLVWMLGGVLATFVLAFVLKRDLGDAARPRRSRSARPCSARRGSAFGLGFLLLLRELHAEHGRLVTFTVLLTVWAADTFAYFGGRLLGRHKLAPTLSPGKTWEGFVVGSVAGIFVVVRRALRHAPHVPGDLAGGRARRSWSCSPRRPATCSSRC